MGVAPSSLKPYPPTPFILAGEAALRYLRRTLLSDVRRSLPGLYAMPDGVPVLATATLPPRELLFFDEHEWVHRFTVPEEPAADADAAPVR